MKSKPRSRVERSDRPDSRKPIRGKRTETARPPRRESHFTSEPSASSETNFRAERPVRGQGRPEQTGERPQWNAQRPDRNEERPKWNQDRPERGSERPERSFNRYPDRNERPERNEERPKWNQDRPERSTERSFNRYPDRNDRSERNEERPKWNQDRPERSLEPYQDRNSDRDQDRPERTKPVSALQKRPPFKKFDNKFERTFDNRPDPRRSEFRSTRPPSDLASPESSDLDLESGDDPELIYGRHGVLEVLKATRPLNRVWVVETLRYDNRFLSLLDQAKSRGVPIDVVTRERLDRLAGGGNHQGIAAQVAAYQYWELTDLITKAQETTPKPLLVIAEGLEDPQNLGSLIRSCEAMGVQGLIVPQRRAVGVTATVAKVSAGAIEHLAISRVVNLRQALEQLKEAGFWIVGTSSEANKSLQEVDLTGPVALVIGSEHKGLNLLTQTTCDLVCSIPLAGKTESLNAAVAGAVAIYEAVRQRKSQWLHLNQSGSSVPGPVAGVGDI